MSNIKRRVKWNKHGVSEIIGNILILGITVTLFSSIMWFVTAMPTPQEHAYADMTSGINTGYSPSTGGWASISVSHKGGQELKNDATGIYIWINDSNPLRFKINSSAPSIGNSWTAGEVWHINLTNVVFPVGKDPSRARISLMITDTAKNSEVYTVILNGGESATSPIPPIIGARGTTPSPTYVGDSFYYYVTVTDPNNDLRKHSVYLDASAINPIWGSLKMSDSNNDGVFTVASPAIADLSWNGKVVLVNATDNAGHSAIGRITLSILYKSTGGGTQYGPYYNYSSYFVNGTYPPDATGGESGGSGGVAGTTFYYIRHLPDMVITRNFEVGDQVMIEIYSDALKNLALENDFFLYHPLTGNPLTPPTSTDAFKYGGIYGTFHRYIFNFTVPSVGLIYPIQIKLKDNTGTVTNIVDQINVGGANYPGLLTYRLDSVTGNFVACKDFNHTDRVYIKMITKDVDPVLTTVTVGTMEISDYTGRYIIKATPPAASAYPAAPNYVAPMSSVYKTGPISSTRLADNNQVSTTKYTVYLDLKDAYQGWWLPRTNAYTMRLSLLSDTGPATGEIYYSQSVQINITAPLTTTDIVASIGSGSYTWSSTGASWTNNKLAWFSNAEGNGQWKKTTIADPTYSGPLAMFLSDINNDGYNDLVVGYQDAAVSIAVYYNQKADGSTWSESPTLICPAFDANPGLQAANTNDKGLANEDVSVYKTQNGKRFYGDSGDYLQNELVVSMASGDFDSDGDQDVVASFTHIVTYTNANGEGSATWDNSRPMFFNRGIYVFWNEGSWIKQQLYGTNTYTNADTNPAATSVATADFNQDGYPDIVGVYEDGTTKVWLNRYMESTGDKRAGAFGTAASLVTLAPTVAGTNPWRWDTLSQSNWPDNYALAKVVAEQIGYGNYPDIVRTSTSSNTVSVFYTTPTSATQTLFNPFNQYGLATVTGTMGNLASNDSKWENLTEAYLNYPIDKATPTAKGISDDTGQSVNNLWSSDGSTYQVNGSKTMYLTAFGTNAGYAGKIVASAWLTIKYSADSNYGGTQSLKISTNEGATTTTTNITPQSNENNKIGWYNLLANGVNTYSKLSSLDVSFLSNSPPGQGSVRIDYLWLQVEFVDTRAVDWTWELNNTITSPLHELTVVGKVLAVGETFQLMYSPDNTNWFNLTQISSTTQTTWVFQLDHTTNSKYFFRVVDLNRGAAEQPSGDMINNTVCLNWIQLRNFMPQVTWLTSDKVDIAPISGLGSGTSEERVTAIAVGDLGKISGDHKADGWPDIVVGTSKVGGGDETHSVYILAQTGEKSFTSVPLTTHNLAVTATSNALYDIANINLGDLNGDGNLDIVFTVGFAPGQSTSTPAATLWMIENEPLPGAWQFTDQPVNVLGANQAAINAITGNVDLTIFMPFLGVLGVLAAEAITRKRKK
jgi:hypothetical protein